MKKNKHDLKGDIGYWLNRLRMEVHQAFEARLEAFDVTVAQWCILLSVYNEEANSVTQLAQYIEVDKASISRVIERLIEKGLVEHCGGSDKRSRVVRLTAKGAKLIPQLINSADENEREFFGALTDRESAQLQQIMNKVFQKIPSIQREGWLTEQKKLLFDPKEIERIVEQGRAEKWSYPRIFDKLKAAGVTSYEVVLSPFQITYRKGNNAWQEPMKTLQLQVNVIFNAEKIVKAIRRNQNKETDYPTFLKEIAEAGVHHYRVTMAERTISYFGSSASQCHVESVPVL